MFCNFGTAGFKNEFKYFNDQMYNTNAIIISRLLYS